MKITFYIILLMLPILLLRISNSNSNNNTEYEGEFDDSLSIDDTLYNDSSYFPVDTTSILINSMFTYMILDNFVTDAVNNGLDSSEVVEHINRLDFIIVDEFGEEEGVYGATYIQEDTSTWVGLRGAIVISKNTLMDWDFFQLTLYHELGHWFGLEHCGCEDHIMMDHDYEKGLKKVFRKWDKKVSHLMKLIEEKYDEKSSFSFPKMDTLIIID